MKQRGGKRAGSGRKPSVAGALAVSRSIATEVLSRLGELGVPGVKTQADFALHLMRTDKRATLPIFFDMLNRAHGKAAQAVIAEGKLVIEVVEMRGREYNAATEADEAQRIM